MSIKDKFELSMINILLKMRQVKKSESQSLDQLENQQHNRFIDLLKHVIKNSEFYRNYYTEHGVNLEKLDQVAPEDLPIIDKEIMMKNFDQFVCDKSLKKNELEIFLSSTELADGKYKGKYEVIHTSGSSGSTGIYVYGPNDWSMLKSLVATRVYKNEFRLFRRMKLAYIGLIDGHFAGISLAKDIPRLLFNFMPIDICRPIQESITTLNEYMPDSISGYASGVYLLALEQLKGNLKISPKRILCSAEPLTDLMAETIHKAFGVKPINFYAATESIGMAAQCDLNQGLHMFNDWHIFEVIKQNGELAGPGEMGNLVITTLYNYTQPLIRYKMTDEVILSEKSCSCGWPFPLISKIAGREEELLWFEKPDGNGEYLHPILFVEFFVIGLDKLQVVQVKKNTLKLNVVIHGDVEVVSSRIRNKMDEILKKKDLITFVEYELNIVEDIANDIKTGKYRLIVPFKE